MPDESNEQWRAAVGRPLELDWFRPTSAAIRVEVAGASVCGRRAHNTDHYMALRLGRLQETLTTSLAAGDLPPRFEEYGYALLVADGLSAQGAGARASRITLSALAHLAIRYGQWNLRIDPETSTRIALQGEFFFRRVHDAVLQASLGDPHLTDMATSLTAVYIAERDLFFAHVGHSRAYLFREGTLSQLTMDHTLEARRRGSAGPKGLEHTKPDVGHIVTETVGGRPAAPDVAVEHVKLSSRDRLLLCTNGLTDVVHDDQIADTLALQRRPSDDCQRLIELARLEGNPDDVTVLVADYRLSHEATDERPPHR